VSLCTPKQAEAHETPFALTFSLYISSPTEGDLLLAKGIRTVTAARNADFMHLNLYVERPHPQISGLIVGELGGPLHKLVQMITTVLNETGEILDNSGYMGLGSFVAEALQPNLETYRVMLSFVLEGAWHSLTI
jgi:hypothetical protein